MNVGIATKESPVGLGQTGDRSDLVFGEFEPEYVEVLALSFGRGRLRDGECSELEVPAQDDLPGVTPYRSAAVAIAGSVNGAWRFPIGLQHMVRMSSRS